MIRKIGMTWQRLITVTLFIVTIFTSSFMGTAAAQTTGNAQTATNSATVTNAVTDTKSVSQVVYYSKKQVLADGGIRYTFNINGVENILHVPPAGFDPMTATDAQLTEYGYPARPKDQKGLTGWQNTWGRFKPEKSSEEPTITIMKGTINDSSGTNWAGYASYFPGQTGKFNQVYGYYNQPSYNVNSPSDAHEASWVGLGGIGSTSPLIQAGTMMEAPTPTYFAWYEYLTSSTNWGPYTMNQVTVHPGDSMYAYVYYLPGSYPGGFEVWDWTTFTYFYVTVAVPPNYYDGESAEFIDERPLNTSNKLYYPVAGFNTPISWTNCEVFYPNNNNPNNFGTLQPTPYTMYGGTGYPLVTPSSPPGANSFTDTWSVGHYQ